MLKEAEVGAKTSDLARRHGVSEVTFYNWKPTMADNENAKLKRLLADTMIVMLPNGLPSLNVRSALSMQESIGIDGASLHK